MIASSRFWTARAMSVSIEPYYGAVGEFGECSFDETVYTMSRTDRACGVRWVGGMAIVSIYVSEAITCS